MHCLFKHAVKFIIVLVISLVTGRENLTSRILKPADECNQESALPFVSSSAYNNIILMTTISHSNNYCC